VTSGWTGGQYSLVRFALGASLAVLAVRELSSGADAPATLGVIALASLALAIGWHDRTAAAILAILLLFHRDPAGLEPAATAIPLLLVLHALQRPAPFGSWAARGRVDPGGGWRLRDELLPAAWVLLALAHAAAGLEALRASRHTFVLAAAGLQLAFGPLALVRRIRPWLWLTALVAYVALAVAGIVPPSLGMVLLHLFTFDPAWVPRRAPGMVETLFYDGSCGLCHRAVRFVLAEDVDGAAFRFAPLDSEIFRASVPQAERERLPDSLVLRTADGLVLTRSAAVRHLMDRLGGFWRVLAIIATAVPGNLQDAAYDTVARLRHRLFARPKDACPLLPAHLRGRFSA
jgi:predicted DCC family thiol-disulfide oxidoreductase YuxK